VKLVKQIDRWGNEKDAKKQKKWSSGGYLEWHPHPNLLKLMNGSIITKFVRKQHEIDENKK
jgi:hypothetical protein